MEPMEDTSGTALDTKLEQSPADVKAAPLQTMGSAGAPTTPAVDADTPRAKRGSDLSNGGGPAVGGADNGMMERPKGDAAPYSNGSGAALGQPAVAALEQPAEVPSSSSQPAEDPEPSPADGKLADAAAASAKEELEKQPSSTAAAVEGPPAAEAAMEDLPAAGAAAEVPEAAEAEAAPAALAAGSRSGSLTAPAAEPSTESIIKTEEFKAESPSMKLGKIPFSQHSTGQETVAAPASETMSGLTKVDEVMAPATSVAAMAKQLATSSSTSPSPPLPPSGLPPKPSEREKDRPPIDPSTVVKASDKIPEVMAPTIKVSDVAKQLVETGGSLSKTSSTALQREGSASKPMVVLSEHDTKNTANVAMVLQNGEFKLQPGQDFVVYDELIKLRLEDGIDVTRKEEYLDGAEFATVFKMDKEGYAKLPAWKRLDLKKKVNLF